MKRQFVFWIGFFLFPIFTSVLVFGGQKFSIEGDAALPFRTAYPRLQKENGEVYWASRPSNSTEVWNLHFLFKNEGSQLEYRGQSLATDYFAPKAQRIAYSEGKVFRIIAYAASQDALFQTDFDARTDLGEPPFGFSEGNSGRKSALGQLTKIETLDLMVKIPRAVSRTRIEAGKRVEVPEEIKTYSVYRVNEEGGLALVYSGIVEPSQKPAQGQPLKGRSLVPGYQVMVTESSRGNKQGSTEKQNAGTSEYFDIVVTADDFTEENISIFQRYAEDFGNRLFAIQPFEALQDKIRIHILPNTTEDLGCRHSNPAVPRVVTCNSAKVLGYVNAMGLPYEQGAVAVIYFSKTYGGAATNIGVCTSGNPENQVQGPSLCLAHELAHSAFRLMDEYAYDDPGYPSEGPEYNEVRMNCFLGPRIPAQEWSDVVALKDYTQDCKYAHNYYRPHGTSLMFTLGAPFFNWPSLQIVRNTIEEAAGPTEDRQVPEVSFGAPNEVDTEGREVKLARGVILLHPWATDASGKVPVIRVLINGFFFRSILGDKLSLETSSDEIIAFAAQNGFTEDQITLQFEAEDVFGNISKGDRYQVGWNNKKDKRGPKVDWMGSDESLVKGKETIIRVKTKDISGIYALIGSTEGESVWFYRNGEVYEALWTPQRTGKIPFQVKSVDGKANRTIITETLKVKSE